MTVEQRDDAPTRVMSDPEGRAMSEIQPLQPEPEPAKGQVQRAIDHAVMSMFELAFSLEALDEAIRRFNAETSRELRDRSDISP